MRQTTTNDHVSLWLAASAACIAVPWLSFRLGGGIVPMSVFAGVLAVVLMIMHRSSAAVAVTAFSGQRLLVAGGVLVMVGACLAGIVNEDPYYGQPDARSILISGLLMVGAAVAFASLSRRPRLPNVMLGAALGTFVVVIVVLPFVLSGHNTISAIIEAYASGSARSVGRNAFLPAFSSLEPTLAVTRLSENLRYQPALCLVAGLALVRPELASRRIGIVRVIAVAVVILTLGRAAILALVVGGVLSALPLHQRQWRQGWLAPRSVAVAISAVLVVVAVIAVAPEVQTTVGERLQGQDNASFETRNSALSEAYDQFGNALFGLETVDGEPFPPHVAILDGLYGGGILGMVGFSLIVLWAIRVLFSALFDSYTDETEWHRKAQIQLTALVIVRLFSAGSAINDLALWFSVGAIVGIRAALHLREEASRASIDLAAATTDGETAQIAHGAKV